MVLHSRSRLVEFDDCTIQHISVNVHLSKCSLCPKTHFFSVCPPPFFFSLSKCPCSVSGDIPDTVQISGNELKVLKVDDNVNTTFVCEAVNSIGVRSEQLTAMIRGELKDAHLNTCAL